MAKMLLQSMPTTPRARTAAVTAAVTTFAFLGLVTAPAMALPSFKVHSSGPSYTAPGDPFPYLVEIENVGTTATTGTTTVQVTVPTGMLIAAATGSGWSCAGAPAATRTCTRGSSIPARAGRGSFAGGGAIGRLTFTVANPAATPGAAAITVQASGGGAPAPTLYTDPLVVGTSPGFGPFEFSGIVNDENGEAETQAGGHPFEASTTIRFNTRRDFAGTTAPDEGVKSVDVELPPGFIGDPSATPVRCSREAFLEGAAGSPPPCPISSQVGIATVWDGTGALIASLSRTPVFNIDPPPGIPAHFGFRVNGFPVYANGAVRTGGDYGITIKVRNVPQTIAAAKTTFTLWGVPADSSHDPLRGSCLLSVAADSCPTDAPRRPFLTNPTDCSAGPLTTRLRVDSWQNPGVIKTASFDHDENGVPMEVEDCEQLEFDPTITAQPVKHRPDVPSGYEVELRVPQNDNPDGLATAHLKKAVVTLPQGVSVSPSSAHGLQACSPAQIGIDNDAQPTCPAASRVGTLEVDTPLLEETMTGDIYVAKQNDNPFNSLLAIYLVARGPGVVIKLPGKVVPDPNTGQLTTTFDNNPQLPFTRFKLTFKDGPNAPLANPPSCGTHTVTSQLTPWSGNAPATPSDSFSIDCPGVAGFAPLFTAGTVTPVGGSFSPFALRIDRPDGQQYVNGLSLEMPPGLIAKLKDVPLCPEAQAAAGTCGLESRVGTATVGAGPGPEPYYIQGSVSLTGPYKGAPYGLSVSVRAIAGPFDLGTVVVRQAVFIDPVDAHLTVVSDPLPTILEGIPLRLRSINVDIDRPGFVLNPTSCGEKQIKATLSSTEGATHTAVQRFQVGDCQALPLRPRLGLRLTGRRQVRDGRHPGLRAVLTQRAGQANLKKVAVRLPLSLALDPDNARSLCEFEDGLRVNCPRSSIIGSAVAHTPILNRPLRGPVYFVKGVRIDPKTGRRIRTLPTLLIPLRGEVAIDLRARSTVRRGKLVNTFDAVPDAPVSRFELNLAGGRNGILVVTNKRNLCRGRHVAEVEIDGHNGKRADDAVRMRTPCGRRSGLRR